jgi:hypothetical protein
MAVLGDSREEMRQAFQIENRNRDYQVTVYIDGLKIVGQAVLSKPIRDTSHEASDMLRSFPKDYMTLRKPTVFCLRTQSVIDQPPFIVISLKKIDAFHAEEVKREKREEPGVPPGRTGP